MRFVFCTQYRPWTLVVTRTPVKSAPIASSVDAPRGTGWARAAFAAVIDEIGSIRLQCFFALTMALALAAPARAVEAGEAAYVGGTNPVPNGTVGSLDSTSPDMLVFRGKPQGASSPVEIEIAYQKISSFQYRTDVAHHLGVLPAIAVGLVRRRERKHFVTITYADASNTVQVAIFEIPKNEPPELLAMLRARSPHACFAAVQGAPPPNCPRKGTK